MQKYAPDRSTGSQGNYVIIRYTGKNPLPFSVVVMLAHFQEDSVSLSVGERVKAGQLIARVGASGTSPTGAPTLHMQANEYRLSGVYGIFGRSVPMTFEGRFLVKNDLVVK